MKREEYLKTAPMTYREYCGYLQQKYGVGRSAYMTASWNKSKKCTRTNEGLFTHHIFEDHAIMRSSKGWAIQNPYEWQLAENLVYCDYLEHLLLHILICEYPEEDANLFEDVGVGGVVNFLVPQLNDLYSCWQPQKDYIKVCFALVREDKPPVFGAVEALQSDRRVCALRRKLSLQELQCAARAMVGGGKQGSVCRAYPALMKKEVCRARQTSFCVFLQTIVFCRKKRYNESSRITAFVLCGAKGRQAGK